MPKVIRHIESPVAAVRAVPIRALERRRRSTVRCCMRPVDRLGNPGIVVAVLGQAGEVFASPWPPAAAWPLASAATLALVECLAELGAITADDLEAHRLAYIEARHRLDGAHIARALEAWAERAGKRLPRGWRQHLGLEG